jgi:hypothetical protein
MEKNELPQYKMPERPKGTSDDRIKEILEELFESTAKKIILLGDKPIEWFLYKVSDCKKRYLSDFGKTSESYGKITSVTIEGRQYDVLTLVHPRQAAKLGKSDPEWYNLHQEWIKKPSLL